MIEETKRLQDKVDLLHRSKRLIDLSNGLHTLVKRLSRYILNKGRGSYPERLDQLAEEINLKPSTRREKEKWNLVAKKIGQLGYASPDHFDTDIKNIHKERNLIAHPNDFPTGNNVVNSE